ncbi:MAG: Nif3-like dinuclear metal center hexameric protein [Cyclobacteriaceae bacterium]|nr:Nif3-like dinuclear metal center hexameric protein [Cyclobacteriaceae bacterium]
MKIKEVTNYLESIAPLSLQESYDNCGLLTGNHDWKVTSVLVTLDCTEDVVQEAIEKGANLIVAHHPIIFSGLKKLNGYNHIEKTIITAIKNDIAIYAWHTNLDHVKNGVNAKICDRLLLSNRKILRPLQNLMKLVTFVPEENTNEVLDAMYKVGAGNIGEYEGCSFSIEGKGTFTPKAGAKPFVGSSGNQEEVIENRLEVIFPAHRESSILNALKNAHPYEEVAYYLHPLNNVHQDEGAGMIGELEAEMDLIDFLAYLKEKMVLNVVKYTPIQGRGIKKVAVCGGSGKFLLKDAIQHGADVFVTSDFKYHEFFEGEKRVVIADIGHYESEIYTKELISDFLNKKFTTFAVDLSETITNPISYF